MKLYKYRDFSNPSEDDFWRLETLLHREVFWCARPDSLNDPEELSWKCDCTASTATEELLTQLLVKANGRTCVQAKEQSAFTIFSGQLAILAIPIIEGMINQCRSEIGLVCFGTSPDNSILWQRYGGGGAGVCVELEVPEVLLENQLHRVQYQSAKTIHIDQLIRAFLDHNRVGEVYALALLSKPISWSSEEEVRFVSQKQEILVRVDRSQITRLILGDALTAPVRLRIGEIMARLRIEVPVVSRQS